MIPVGRESFSVEVSGCFCSAAAKSARTVSRRGGSNHGIVNLVYSRPPLPVKKTLRWKVGRGVCGRWRSQQLAGDLHPSQAASTLYDLGHPEHWMLLDLYVRKLMSETGPAPTTPFSGLTWSIVCL
ncbi:unnamed protein product, partial [Hapterophycus canaliculatus]